MCFTDRHCCPCVYPASRVWRKGTVLIFTNTIYNTLQISCSHSSPNNPRKTPMARPLGGDMGVFLEFNVWPNFHLNCSIVLYCTAICREFIYYHGSRVSLRRLAMERRSSSLALCEGNPPVTGGFPSQSNSNADLLCFLGCYAEQAVKHTLESSVL